MAKDIKEKSDKALKKELAENRKAYFQFRFGLAGSGTKNVKSGRDTKKEIARILTELRTRR